MPTALASAASSAPAILAYIDTAIGIATFLMSERLPATVANIKSFFSRTRTPEGFDIEDSKSLIALLVVDPELLEIIENKVKGALDEYKKCIKKANMPQESAACDRRAERSVCDSLNRIMDRNNDQLPTQYLKDQWASFGCVRV